MSDRLSATMNKPVPGQSLTKSPDIRAPYEKQPVSTELSKVSKTLFKILTRDQVLEGIARSSRDGAGVSLDRMAAMVLHEAFSTGKMTPDLALLAIEPCIEILMYVCALLDIPVRFSSDDKETDWQGSMKVASKQADMVGASSPATLQEWLKQNEQKMDESEKPVTKKDVKEAISLLAPKGVNNG